VGHPPRLRLSRGGPGRGRAARRPIVVAVVAVVALAGCTTAEPTATRTSAAAPTASAITSATPATVLCRVTDPRVTESSGLAVGRDLVWTHDDSGDGPRLFGLDRTCRVRTVLTLAGTDARDWEDLAVAAGALWVADTGDNRGVRDRGVLVHRVPEPTATGALRAAPRSFRLRYEDGPRDAEALLVHPVTGEVVVVEKQLFGAAGVYAAPQPMAPGALRRVGELGVGAVTGGSVSPRGDRVVLRTYVAAYEWEVTGDLASALAGTPTRTELPPSEQGEGIAYDADGRSWLLSSEGEGAPLHRVPR
jgi:hypothetical protein